MAARSAKERERERETKTEVHIEREGESQTDLYDGRLRQLGKIKCFKCRAAHHFWWQGDP